MVISTRVKSYIYNYGRERNCKCIMTCVCLYDHFCIDQCGECCGERSRWNLFYTFCKYLIDVNAKAMEAQVSAIDVKMIEA